MEIIFWKIINSFPLPNNVSMQVWSKSIHLFRRYRTETIFWIFQSGTVILKIRSMPLKFDQLLPSLLPTMYIYKFGQNPSTSSEDNAWKPYSKWTFQSDAVTLKIRSRSPSFDHLFLSSHQCIYASLVKLHPLDQKISREAIFWTFQCTPVTLTLI